MKETNFWYPYCGQFLGWCKLRVSYPFFNERCPLFKHPRLQLENTSDCRYFMHIHPISGQKPHPQMIGGATNEMSKM